MESCVLITNLAMIHVGDVHLTAHALLLVDKGDHKNGPRFVARGFGTEAVDERLVMPIPSLSYTFTPDDETAIARAFAAQTLTTHGTLRVINTACAHDGRPEVEHFEAPSYEPCSCVVVRLDCCSVDGRAIDFERLDTPDWSDAQRRQRLWDRLHAKVCSYWSTPFVRVTSQVRTELARKATAGDLR